MNALVIVDLQNDFLPGGALSVKEGDKIIPVVNKLLNMNFDHIIASKDWHPKDHCSFASVHGREVGDVIEWRGIEQILWPTHCVQGSKGAELASGWDTSKVHHFFYKGTDKNIDSYSAFFDNGHRLSTGMEEYLKQEGVNNLYFAGLATDYCVKYSALDALTRGFNVYIIQDACRAVNRNLDDEAKALAEMKAAGAHLITSNALK